MRAIIINKFTPKTNYSRLLERGFREAKTGCDLILYGSKWENLFDLPNAKNVWSSGLYPFQIFKQIHSDKPDVIHIQYEFTTFGPFWTNILFPLLLILVKLSNIKMVITIHSVIPKEMVDEELIRRILPKLYVYGIGKILFKLFLVFTYTMSIAFAERLIVHGEWYKKALINSFGAAAQKISVIPYGVNEENCTDDTMLKKWRNKISKHKVILFFGHISPRKDMETLIRAFSIFHRHREKYLLLVAGKEPPYYKYYCDKLKSVAKDLGLSEAVIFTGQISDDEIHVLYLISDFAVFPYLYGFEGPSGPLAFAIQHGTPIIGTSVGHLGEEISDMNNGLLVQPKNPGMLAEAMLKLADNENLRNDLSKNLKKKKMSLLWKEAAAKTFEIYRFNAV